jgi:hypothetical protein
VEDRKPRPDQVANLVRLGGCKLSASSCVRVRLGRGAHSFRPRQVIIGRPFAAVVPFGHAAIDHLGRSCEQHARWAVILFDYAEKNSREDLPERQIVKPSKKYNMGWENIQKRNREPHADVLRREIEL